MAAKYEGLLANLPTYDEAWALDQFTSALQPRIAELVAIQRPETLTDAILIAEPVELARPNSNESRPRGRQSMNRRPYFQRFGSGRAFNRMPPRTNRPQGRGGYRPQNRLQNRQQQPRRPQQQQGVCWICDSPDHWANQCPNRQRQSSRGGARTNRRTRNAALLASPQASAGASSSQQASASAPPSREN